MKRLALPLVVALAVLALGAPAHADPPANDDFANAQDFGPAPGERIGTNVDATREEGEPGHGFSGERSVWWKWVATESGRFRLDTCDSLPAFNNTLAVYTGTKVSQLQEVAASAANGDIAEDRSVCPNAGGLESLHFDAVKGTLYHFAVAGFDDHDTSLNIRLQLRRTPLNDNFAAASTFPAKGSVTGTNIEATRETGEPETGARTIWWRWTAPRSDRYRLDTCETLPEYNNVLGVYTGTRVSQLREVAYSSRNGIFGDNEVCPRTEGLEELEFDAVAGTTYYFSVGGWDSRDTVESTVLRLTSHTCISAFAQLQRDGAALAAAQRDAVRKQRRADKTTKKAKKKTRKAKRAKKRARAKGQRAKKKAARKMRKAKKIRKRAAKKRKQAADAVDAVAAAQAAVDATRAVVAEAC